jgi:hypothetical protein
VLGVGVRFLVEALPVEIIYFVAGKENVVLGDGEFTAYPLAELQRPRSLEWAL